MTFDDAMERFCDEWIVFKVQPSDVRKSNPSGVVVAHGGPWEPMWEISSRVLREEPGARVKVDYSTGRPIRSGTDLGRVIREFFDTHDYEEWLDEWR